MAPTPGLKAKDLSIDRSTEYDDFMNELEEYHTQRGTILEKEPKVANRHLDLLRLYKRVLEEGGYDRASDTKGNALAWRRIATEFLPTNAHIPTLAFLVKTAYYKNLAAYEISTHWKREPPPKEILEDMTAKGGDLLNRTLENYAPRNARDEGSQANGTGSDGDQTSPRDDRMEVDELANTPGRTTRALRHAPPQRVLFQPDVGPQRSARGAQPGFSPTPGQSSMVNGSYGMSGASMTLANYEPRPMVPSSVKPVATPGNNPDYYANLKKKWIAERNQRRGLKPTKGMMLPGTGFQGPNIYIRAQLSLQSNIPDQVSYALHHLVKISHERGDKYRFESFTGLAEALMIRILSVTNLFYGFEWSVDYSELGGDTSTVLDGVNGTIDLLEKIKSHGVLTFPDGIHSEDFAIRLSNVNEAALVLRNMAMLEENSIYLSNFPLTRDMLTIALNLPSRPELVELRHYALEIAEQLTRYYNFTLEDPLYQSLLAQLTSDDRGIVMSTLRGLTKIAANLEQPNLLPGIPAATLRHLSDYLLVDDEDLQTTTLDFFYTFTAITANVEILSRVLDLPLLVSQLTRLLLHDASPRVERDRQRPATLGPSQPPPASPPKLSSAIVEQLCQIVDEREQSSQWLKTCFEPDPAGEITQIALWQAYNEAFAGAPLQRGLMTAKDFITNVSTTFAEAKAQVVGTNPPKYTIRGISPRRVPVDVKGNPYQQCQWHAPNNNSNSDVAMTGIDGPNGALANASTPPAECGDFFLDTETLWEHVLTAHLSFSVFKNSDTAKPQLRPPPEEEGKSYTCYWAGCAHFDTPSKDPRAVTSHVRTHLPETGARAEKRRGFNKTVDTSAGAQQPQGVVHGGYNGNIGYANGVSNTLRTNPSNNHSAFSDNSDETRIPKRWLSTPVDERNEPQGLSLASSFVLRNLARQLAKVEAAKPPGARKDGDGGLVAQVFGPVKGQLGFVGAYNWALREQVGGVLRLVGKGGA